MSFTLRFSYKKFPLKKKYSYSKYRSVLELLLYEISKAIIYDKYSLKLPHGGGIIKIIKVTVNNNNKKIDYKYYNDTGKVRYLLNRHTNGYYFMWHWDTKRCIYKNCKLYKMIPNRGNDKVIGTRGLAKHIIDCSKDPYKKDYDVLTLR